MPRTAPRRARGRATRTRDFPREGPGPQPTEARHPPAPLADECRPRPSLASGRGSTGAPDILHISRASARAITPRVTARPALYLEDLTWPEAERALLELPTVVLPLGARAKEHGRHLPLNNDWLIAEYLARRVAAECPVLILPTLQYGHYPAFLEYPGSISLRADACRDTIIDICQSLIPHGARRFYVLNTGISTIPPLQAAASSIGASGALFEFTDIRTDYAFLRRRLTSQPAGSHADELETSIMLYIAPDLVRLELAERDIHPDLGPGRFHRDPTATDGIYSKTGAYGDPTLASRDKGHRLVEGMVAHLIQTIRRLSAQTPPLPPKP
jgi:creatinine amidohydrolase